MNEEIQGQLAIIEHIVNQSGFIATNTGAVVLASLKNRNVTRQEVTIALEQADVYELVDVTHYYGGRIAIAPIN